MDQPLHLDLGDIADTTGCGEFSGLQVSRRAVLQGALFGGAATVMFTAGDAVTQTAFGNAPNGNILVLLSLRGACDGMSMMVPHGDPVYYQSRPSISIPKNQLLAADDMFGLHPNFASLMPWWKNGSMAAIHATGMVRPNRSHFEAMEIVEEANPGSKVREGWMNRLVGLEKNRYPETALNVGTSVPPTLFSGRHDSLSLTKLNTASLGGSVGEPYQSQRERALKAMWSGRSGVAADGVKAAMRAVDAIEPAVGLLSTRKNVTYPSGSLGLSLQQVAHGIKEGLRIRTVNVDYGSWDHHQSLGNAQSGQMTSMVKHLSDSLAAFFNDLGSALSKRVTVVTVSEFGRRTKENTSRGLDHGHGNVMFALGAGVKGGYYCREWTPLTDTVNGDLLVTTDYRDVLAEVLKKQLGANPSKVFPGLMHRPVGYMR